MQQRIHALAGGFALAIIATFWASTVLVELSGVPQHVIALKQIIPWGFLVLIPALAMAGGTGLAMTRGRSAGLAAAKKRRMPLIAANGLLVLVPSALILAERAGSGRLDALFYGIQAVELIAGGFNIALLSLNVRDGLRLAGRLGAPHR